MRADPCALEGEMRRAGKVVVPEGDDGVLCVGGSERVAIAVEREDVPFDEVEAELLQLFLLLLHSQGRLFFFNFGGGSNVVVHREKWRCSTGGTRDRGRWASRRRGRDDNRWMGRFCVRVDIHVDDFLSRRHGEARPFLHRAQSVEPDRLFAYPIEPVIRASRHVDMHNRSNAPLENHPIVSTALVSTRGKVILITRT